MTEYKVHKKKLNERNTSNSYSLTCIVLQANKSNRCTDEKARKYLKCKEINSKRPSFQETFESSSELSIRRVVNMLDIPRDSIHRILQNYLK